MTDRILMLEHSIYSVISPEGCAAILWRSAEHREKAAEALRITSGDLARLGMCDEVVPEPGGRRPLGLGRGAPRPCGRALGGTWTSCAPCR